jgi:molecular chaperone HscC
MILGIDLGTTNSLAAIWRDGVELVPNALGSVLTPSIVSLDRTGEIVVGAAARERLTSHPDMTAAAFKRYMGTSRRIPLGPRSFRAEELSSFVIRSLHADAEALLGAPIDEAVITVPAYFSDAQRRATRLAGELAGLKVERVLNEPTAAALAYGLVERDRADGPVLVFDLGGGTFDVSVLEMNDGIVEVRATAGDNFLGGEDFDEAVAAWFADAVGMTMPDALTPEGQVPAARLRRAAEAARRALSAAPAASMTLALPDGSTREAKLTAETFARIAEPLLERLRKPIARALSDSRIRPDELSHVVLAGGATRMPIVRREAARLFGRLPLQTLDPDEVVGRGAGVQAGLKMRSAALADIVLTDVAPYTLGIEVNEGRPGASSPGRMLPVIERNTVVPVSRMRSVVPGRDFQRVVEVSIFQGEARLVRDNIPLGSFELALSPRRIAEQSIEVRFTYDINGILEVSAKAEADGASERIVIRHGPDAATAEEAEARMAALADLKIHPREQAANRLLLARGERVFEEQLGRDRERVGAMLARFEAAIDKQEPIDIEQAGAALAHLLHELEVSR